MIRQATFGPVLAAMLVGASWAQDSGQLPATPSREMPDKVEIVPEPPKFIPSQTTDQVLASRILSADVVTTAGEKIGAVKDLVIDKSGRTVGVVVSFGGVMGIGSKDVAVPFTRMRLESGAEADSRFLQTDLSQAELEAAPEFESNVDRQSKLPKPDSPAAGGK